MFLKSLAIAAALVLVGTAARAEDLTVTVDLIDGKTGTFGVTHLQGGLFTDVFTFTGADAGGIVTASAITIGFTDVSNIDFTSAILNGVALNLSGTGDVETATLPPTALTGPLELTVTGIAAPGGASPVVASYAGTINVSAIPEPETMALMLAGIGAMGFLLRRRQPG